ncbi:neutral zinc metallopeptidase [Rhizohabitans arisaemae]|uniref:neutral zinc metallopeptidase n=1 Tax=Rhizohabitans arisaemae TaxID=2720610 RepID=UPI0024B13555|nr:neutral zinc metallopeptidase [Rhizohabitans arisaemae]
MSSTPPPKPGRSRASVIIAVLTCAIVAVSVFRYLAGNTTGRPAPTETGNPTPTSTLPRARPAAEPAPSPIAARRAKPGKPPTGRAAAVSGPLYRLGRLPAVECRVEPFRAGDLASAKRHLHGLNGCLDRAWARQFREAGQRFRAPSLKIVTKPVRSSCGWWVKDVAGTYCGSSRTMYILIDKDWLTDPGYLFPASVVAHEYGHHIQLLTGISAYYDATFPPTKAGELALSRRFELQAECLAGVALSTVRAGLPIEDRRWQELLETTRESGDEAYKDNDHGKGANIARWLDRGYRSGAPSACNTWTASKRSVG